MMRLLTMNVNQYDTKFGPWARRRPLLVDVIRAAEPDVIVLQAVRSTPHVAEGRDQARQIAELLTPPTERGGYAYCRFEAAGRSWDGTQIGVGIIARRPLLEERVAPLHRQSGSQDALDRVVLGARVAVDETPVSVVNAYASWVPADGLANVTEILAFAGTWERPCIIAGDFNADPGAPALAPLVEAGFIDAWAQLRPNDLGATHESGRATRRIDYAFVSPDLAPALVDIHLVGTGMGADGTRPSDHYGLVVTLDLARRRRPMP